MVTHQDALANWISRIWRSFACSSLRASLSLRYGSSVPHRIYRLLGYMEFKLFLHLLVLYIGSTLNILNTNKVDLHGCYTFVPLELCGYQTWTRTPSFWSTYVWWSCFININTHLNMALLAAPSSRKRFRVGPGGTATRLRLRSRLCWTNWAARSEADSGALFHDAALYASQRVDLQNERRRGRGPSQ